VTIEVDESRLDDPEALAAADPEQMLRAVATSAAQVRAARTAAVDAGLEALREEGRPRAVVVAGMGGSGIAGDVLLALATATSPVPVVVHRGPGLPGWVGAADLVLAVSCSGGTAETLAATDEAIRRGSRLVGVAGGDSPLAERCRNARAPLVAVTQHLAPRASLWSLAVPVLVAASRVGAVDLGDGDADLELLAQRLEQVAEACRPDRESFVNPAKTLALELAGTLPMVWGAGPSGAVLAYRFACQLAENAKLPAVTGVLPEAHHNQVVALAGAFAQAQADDDDIFRDRVEEPSPLRLRLVVPYDDDGDAETAARVEATERLADEHGVLLTVLRSEGAGPLERMGSLVGLIDAASVYLAIGQGVDPTPVLPIDELKQRLAQRVRQPD
jgi:glucose/mannose-6-phosphate isomerase